MGGLRELLCSRHHGYVVAVVQDLLLQVVPHACYDSLYPLQVSHLTLLRHLHHEPGSFPGLLLQGGEVHYKALKNRCIQAGLAEGGYEPAAGQSVHSGGNFVIRHSREPHLLKKTVQERHIDKLLVSQGRGVEEEVGVDGVAVPDFFDKVWFLHIEGDIGFVQDWYLFKIIRAVGALLVGLEQSGVGIRCLPARKPFLGLGPREHRDDAAVAVCYKLALYELVEESVIGLVCSLEPPQRRLCAQRCCGASGVEPARHYASQENHAEPHLQFLHAEVCLAQGCLYQSLVYRL